jgi:N-acetylglutamate synthase-like GNAT family acetyltransferase
MRRLSTDNPIILLKGHLFGRDEGQWKDGLSIPLYVEKGKEYRTMQDQGCDQENINLERNCTTEVVLRNGLKVTIRQAEARDVKGINEMHDRLSKETLYYRYLGPNKPAVKEFEALCTLGINEGKVLIATINEAKERVIGVTCYYIDSGDPTVAEPAILVEDELQGCGLGKKMLQVLTRGAWKSGVKAFLCFTLPANIRVHQIIKKSGVDFVSKYRDGLKMFRIQLDPDPGMMAA